MVMTQKEVESFAMPQHNHGSFKRISVSSKRQISIPKKFYEQLGIGDEVRVELHGNHLVLKPVHENFEDFSEEILEDLIAQGYSGNQLMIEFKNRKGQLGTAIASIISETMNTGKRTTVDDLFGENDDQL